MISGHFFRRWGWAVGLGLGAILAGLLIWWIYSGGVERGERSRDGEVAGLIADRDTLRRNQSALELAIAEQNAAVEALAEAARQSGAAAARSTREAARMRETTAALRARLAAEPPPDEGRAVPLTPDQQMAWELLR